MNTKIRSFAFCLTACLLGCLTGYAYEQDNWYLHGPIDGNLSGVFHQEYNATAKKDMLYRNVTGVGLEVRDINGTLLQTINTGGITFTDIEYDQNTSRLFGINANYLSCFEQNSSGQWEETWKFTGHTITSFAQGPNGKLYGARNTKWVYILEQNGTNSSSFTWVDGINSLGNHANVAGFISNQLIVSGRFDVQNVSSTSYPPYKIFSFDENGQKLSSFEIHSSWSHASSGSQFEFRIAQPNTGFYFYRFRHRAFYGWSNLVYSPNSNIFTISNSVDLWLQNGDFISGSNLYRRTFRTKMETDHNSVPQPVIHRIAQRTGTNVMELDFEVIDTDDDNVTVGILAYCGSDKLVPQAWLNGSGSKIGTPIATNTVHSMEWDVKQDWPDSTGAIKFEILCQDGSRDKPVDLHFIKLPFADGNMTISRSPLRESDFVNYAKFLLATGQAQFESNTSNAVILPAEANTTEVFTFTNCGATGRDGPTEAQIQAEYNGTNLHNQVTTGWKAGYQEWTVPATGDYWIEAVGARGGHSANHLGGAGSFVRGKFTLNENSLINIVVGQRGLDNTLSDRASSGGGGTFVVADTNNTPLVIAGGGGGVGPSFSFSTIASTDQSGNMGEGSPYTGGSDGFGASGERGGGGGGFLTSGTGNSNQGGKSFQVGARGGKTSGTYQIGFDGGFGGGGATQHNTNNHGAGGGGYSGGGGSKRDVNNYSGGGGSYNGGSSKYNLIGFGSGHGMVRILRAESTTPTMPKVILLNSAWKPVGAIGKLISKLGPEYRAAYHAEVTKAREAATPGGVNEWTATNQVKPRNLPGKVNEYGFDVSTTSGFWVIKE